ncbi:hypothetical protein [Paenibacillus sp.]|nr:hypothetical protein [Paenibacillus sp.]HZG85285.1 hypothetical protein [Paenibacillus sp.]
MTRRQTPPNGGTEQRMKWSWRTKLWFWLTVIFGVLLVLSLLIR